MFKSLALTLLSALAAVEAVSEKCTNELGGIVYEPQTYAREYMTKVAANFNLGRAALFTPQADSYISSFEQDWGVTIQVLDADSICLTNIVTNCSTALSEPLKSLLTSDPELYIPIGNNVTISSISISIEGQVPGSGGFGTYNLTSPSGTVVELSATPICVGESIDDYFNLIFTDDAPSTYDCATQNSSIILAPTQPLSIFAGEYSGGFWNLTSSIVEGSLYSAQITYCQSSSDITCSRDAMKALTNIPGYRYDSGSQMVYYTEDVFDAFGNFRQVTISRPINGLYLKK